MPNTVTKTLHTDKVYEPDLNSFTIEPFPYYSPLKSQIETISVYVKPEENAAYYAVNGAGSEEYRIQL